MKNSDLFEPPLVNVERNSLLILVHLLLSIALDYVCYTFFIKMSAWGFLLLAPAAVLSFQSLWLILNPFAMIFKDRVEFKYSLFGNRRRYFTDIKKIVKAKDGKTYLVFTDDEAEPLKLFGIRKSHINLLMQELQKQMDLAKQPVS